MGRDRFSATVTCDIEVPVPPYCMPVVPGLSKSPSDEYVMYKMLDSGVGYVYCGRTSSQTDRAVSEAIEKLNATKAYIIDLTDCHGFEQATLAAITPYSGNCVALVGPGTAHFGERYARDLTTDIRATLVGSNTAGCASYITKYELPRGLGVVEYSEKQVRGNFEYKGISPSMKQTHEPEPLTKGTTALIQRAERKLKR
ncbi:MAG: hypothetical protein U5N86_06825 [Planctomycetota bacterium]|nr:hypothetical protein [Planctomycetota bacterium]